MAGESGTQASTSESAERGANLLAFLFTDIEGSTRLAQSLGDHYEQVLDRHREIMREAFAQHGGSEVGTEGDSFFAVFSSPAQALRAGSQAQAALAAEPWPAGVDLRVRMGLHVGEARHRDGDYTGVEVHRAARVAAAAHGGQVLLSEAAAAVIGDRIPDDLGLRDLGLHRLKDFDSPARLFQVTGARLRPDFPPIPRRDGRTPTFPPPSRVSSGEDQNWRTSRTSSGCTGSVTLIGTGGSGKTRLMIEAGSRILDRFDGAWLVELASVGQADFVVNEVARGARDQRRTRPPRGRHGDRLPSIEVTADSFGQLRAHHRCRRSSRRRAAGLLPDVDDCLHKPRGPRSARGDGAAGTVPRLTPTRPRERPAPGPDRLVRDDRFHRGSPAIRRPGQRGPEFVFSRPWTTPRPWWRSVAGSTESRLRSNWRRPE